MNKLAIGQNAKFVPPPAHDMRTALGQIEKIIHTEDEYLPLIKAGIAKSFETGYSAYLVVEKKLAEEQIKI